MMMLLLLVLLLLQLLLFKNSKFREIFCQNFILVFQGMFQMGAPNFLNLILQNIPFKHKNIRINKPIFLVVYCSNYGDRSESFMTRGVDGGVQNRVAGLFVTWRGAAHA